MSKPNNLETAREFLESHGYNKEYSSKAAQLFVSYAQSIQAPEGKEVRSAKEIMQDHVDPHCFINSKCMDAVIAAMHEYRSQSLPSVTDEEIEEMIVLKEKAGNTNAYLVGFEDGAKWMRSKLTASDRKEK